MSRTILAATDFSEAAEYALQRAVQLADATAGASLTLTHVVSTSVLERVRAFLEDDATDRRLLRMAQEALSAMATGRACAIETVLLEGSPRITLANFVNTRRADLTVLGSRGTRTVQDQLLGSTTERVLRLTQQPLLAVKQRPTAPYRRVLAAIDESHHAAAAVRVAHSWLPQAEFVLLHALEPDLEIALRLGDASDSRIEQYRTERHAEARVAMARLAESLPIPSHQRSILVTHGSAPRCVLDQAGQLDVDLIVMGKRGLSAVQELLVGSVTQHVLSRSVCDVLVAGADPAQG